MQGKNRLTAFIAFFFILMLPCLLFALDIHKGGFFYNHRSWMTDNGLPQNTVLAITQTPDGLLWLGTEPGLVKFDGLKFDLFNHENTPAIRSDIILTLMVDKKGRLWCGTRGGGAFLVEDGIPRSITSDKLFISGEVWSIEETGDGSTWFGTRKGLYRFYKEKLSRVDLPAPVQDAFISALETDDMGRLWFGTQGNGLYCIELNGTGYEAFHKGFSGEKISDILESKKRTLWLATEDHGVINVNGNSSINYTVRNGLHSNNIGCMYEDKNGNIWIGAYNGSIDIIPAGKNTAIAFSGSIALTGSAVFSFFEDKEHNFWIGTDGGGLNRFRDSEIITYTKKNGLAGDIIHSVFSDSRRNTWFATKGSGVCCMNGESGVFKTFSTRDGLTRDTVATICEYPEDKIWFGTMGGGACRYSTDTGKWDSFSLQEGLSDSFVRALYVDPDGVFWAGTDSGGLHRFENGLFTLEGNVQFRINSFHKDREGVLWIGTQSGGVFRFKNGKLEPMNTNSLKNRLSGLHFYEDRDGGLWIGSSQGLLYYRKGKFFTISPKEGLPDDTIYCVLEDYKNNLWMSSNQGIIRVNRLELIGYFKGKTNHLHFYRYGINNGMKSIECNGGNQNPGTKTPDGRIWFPTTRGVSVIDPDYISLNVSPTQARIEKVRIGKTSYPIHLPVIVPPGNNNVEIYFTAPTFISPEQIQFKYKMEGFNEDWVDAGTLRFVNFSYLPPGSYRFDVIAGSTDGSWNTNPDTFSFTLIPHFYQSFLFKTIFAVITALGGGLYFFYRKYFSTRVIKGTTSNTSLPTEDNTQNLQKIIHFLVHEKAYRNPDITLKTMSSQIMLSSRTISHVINAELKINFNELINQYRIKEAQQILLDPKHQGKSILEIGFEIGFNSKSAFNRVFKEYTQMTPSQYRKTPTSQT